MSLGEGLPVSYTRIFLFSLLLMVAEGGDIHQGGCRKPSVDKRASSACGCGDPPERCEKNWRVQYGTCVAMGHKIDPLEG